MKKSFDPKSAGFFQSVLFALFSITALFGIEYPGHPVDLSNGIVDGITNGGLFSLIGMLITAVITPVYNFIRKGGPINWKTVFGSSVTWVSLGGVAVSGLLLIGLQIDPGTPAAVIDAISARNWGALASLFITSIAIPVIRFIKDLQDKKTDVPAQTPKPPETYPMQ